MDHKPDKRIIPGAKNAILFCHGIVGSPNQFRGGIPITQWVPEDWSVHNLLLPGHGGTVSDFSRSSMAQWREAVWQAFLELASGHQRVYIVAHSMGTLFAMELAVAYPEKIPALFLLGVPMRPHLFPAAINSALRLAFDRLRPGRPEMGILQACGTTPTKLVWRYVPWIPRFLELFVQIRKTEKQMGSLRVPTITFQSRKDELVSNASIKVLRRYPAIHARELMKSTHFYYDPEEQKVVRHAFLDCIKNHASPEITN